MNHAQLLKAMSQPIRLDIIKRLLEGETCSCTLIHQLPISQPTLSYHLHELVKHGIAHSKREGNWIKYYINRDVLKALSVYFHVLSEVNATSCNI